jgi:hypothetical protein
MADADKLSKLSPIQHLIASAEAGKYICIIYFYFLLLFYLFNHLIYIPFNIYY